MTDQKQPNTGNENEMDSTAIIGMLLVVISVCMIGYGLFRAYSVGEYTMFSVGVLSLCVLYGIMCRSTSGASKKTSNIEALLQQQVIHLQTISDRMLLSDHAKQTAFRQKDRDALREAILEDIRIEDYDAAMALANDMADVYGYREEAEVFRAQIHEAEENRRKELIDAAVNRIDSICESYHWENAHEEVNRMLRMYPDSPRVKELHRRVEDSRTARKHELEREFLEAAQHEEVERAMKLMKELDTYLSPQEAKQYVEVARGVIGKNKENLGVRFKMAVQDRDWVRALNAGEIIIRDFPNSLFANEVRSMMDMLRERSASQLAAAQANSTEPPVDQAEQNANA